MLLTTQPCGWISVNSSSKEHFQEWEAQKKSLYELGPLEQDTELAYHRCLARRQAESDTADNHEEEAKKLPPECQAAWELWKQQAIPTIVGVCPVGMEHSLSLYSYWLPRQDTKPSKTDRAHPYKTPKDNEKAEKLSLEEELDADLVFDPLAPSSQTSTAPGSQQESIGPKTPSHFSEGPMLIPPFDISILNIPGKNAALSPMTEQDNAFLGLAPGSPIKSTGLSCAPGGSLSGRGLGCTSGANGPMSVGSLTSLRRGIALAGALKARVPTPAQFKDKDEGSSEEEEEDMECPGCPTVDPHT